MLPAEILFLRSGLGLLQDPDALFFGELLPLYREFSSALLQEHSPSMWTV